MFRMFSQPLHVTARALSADTLHTRRTGTHIRLGRPIPTDFIRGLAVPAICMLLASASRMLGVGCEGELDSLRLQLVGRTLPRRAEARLAGRPMDHSMFLGWSQANPAKASAFGKSVSPRLILTRMVSGPLQRDRRLRRPIHPIALHSLEIFTRIVSA
jgi:hypothetical protein